MIHTERLLDILLKEQEMPLQMRTQMNHQAQRYFCQLKDDARTFLTDDFDD